MTGTRPTRDKHSLPEEFVDVEPGPYPALHRLLGDVSAAGGEGRHVRYAVDAVWAPSLPALESTAQELSFEDYARLVAGPSLSRRSMLGTLRSRDLLVLLVEEFCE